MLVLVSSSLRAQDKAARLSALFDTLKSFNGSVLIAQDDKVIFQQAYGIADHVAKRKLTTESVFELASVSKGFTAMGIMQLKEKKLLSYDDSLRKFFPELPYAGVSIQNLLTHTSGIPDFLGWTEEDINVNARNSNAQIIKILPAKYTGTVFPPGSKFLYSNTNYVLLASIIEQVSGLSFPEYMRKNIFLPCGMANTAVSQRLLNTPPEDYAFDYAWDGGEGRFLRADSLKRYMYYMSGVTGAYGIMSNAGDLNKWVQAINTDLLVSEATRKEAFSPIKFNHSNENITSDDGLISVFGWRLLPGLSGDRDMFTAGSYGGYRSLIVNTHSKSQKVILLSNFGDNNDLLSVMQNIDEILEGLPLSRSNFKELRKGVKLPLQQLRALQGIYLTKEGSFPQMKITCIGNRLYAKLGDSMEQNAFAESENAFFVTGIDGSLLFNKDAFGKVISLSVNNSGTSHTFYLK
ncbi:serine hydrolase domain-containing protein [Dyadobacter crusticola]|uniref:serine hydrolase domain-containing protein n=1 Tax=Dyadobacter crusticola TaxID=292407 RepID=UPI00146FBD6C|nr:serine hydrolase domain-containing protein [Dyadobacter crusticola]